jgi:hypothetical protein
MLILAPARLSGRLDPPYERAGGSIRVSLSCPRDRIKSIHPIDCN